MKKIKTVDFGAYAEPGYMHFYVQVPEDKKDYVRLYEVSDFSKNNIGIEKERARISLVVFSTIADDVKEFFNARLKKEKQRTGNWHKGKVMFDRLLGRELCVLFWALEQTYPKDREDHETIVDNWKAMFDTERWLLYFRTNSHLAIFKNTNGWYRALYHIFTNK